MPYVVHLTLATHLDQLFGGDREVTTLPADPPLSALMLRPDSVPRQIELADDPTTVTASDAICGGALPGWHQTGVRRASSPVRRRDGPQMSFPLSAKAYSMSGLAVCGHCGGRLSAAPENAVGAKMAPETVPYSSISLSSQGF